MFKNQTNVIIYLVIYVATIKGKVRYIIFEATSGYKVGQFHIKATYDEEMQEYKNKTITFTGYFPELNKEDTYIFKGNYIYHNKYGYQFEVKEYQKVNQREKMRSLSFYQVP